MAEYSRIAKGNFTATGTAASAASQYVNLPFQPDFVEIWNYTNMKLGVATANKVVRAWWDNKFLDGSNNPTFVETYNAAGSGLVFDEIPTGGITSYYAGLALQYGAALQISGITKANPAVVTTT